jgi:hypothetical protein
MPELSRRRALTATAALAAAAGAQTLAIPAARAAVDELRGARLLPFPAAN